MRIVGEWWPYADGATRPTIVVHVHGAAGLIERERFLIDSGADRTVLAADLLYRLRLQGERPPPGLGLVGIGGGADFVTLPLVMDLLRDDGRAATVSGEFAAFADVDATDLSILGRDVLDNFDVILSRRRDEVLLLAPNHSYQVSLG